MAQETYGYTSIPEVGTSTEVDHAEHLPGGHLGDEDVCGLNVSVYYPACVQRLRERERA